MKLKPMLLMLGAILAPPAQAAFYVDSNAVAAETAMASPAAPAAPPAAMTIPFYGRRASLGPLGRHTLQTLLDAARQAGHIRIVGHGDRPTQLALAARRAQTLQHWLTQHGISAARMETAVSATVLSGSQRHVYASEIVLIPPTAPATPVPAPFATGPLADAPPPPAPAGQLPTDRLLMINKVLALSRDHTVQPAAAMALLAALLQPVAPAAAAPAQIVPASEPIRTYTLTSTLSLKDNLIAWAKLAGWQPPEWDADNPYQITFTSTYRGTFIDVLHQIAQQVPSLNFQVWPQQRRMRITDGGH